ncbi:MAG: amino acid carrier protein [Candidatus Hydrogenedens sp.]|nr:amino acid carrier protein [Candidatus Hydrogenedens sp.]
MRHLPQRAAQSSLLFRLAITGLLALGALTAHAQEAAEAPLSAAAQIQQNIDAAFAGIVSKVAPVLFFDPAMLIGKESGVPLIVLVLFCGGVFFTLRYSFVNIRLFTHAIYVVRGHFDNPEEKGEISHFQALTSALAATVGLGNIAGVAVAITAGGPGAIFWMWFTAFFGMSMKFSCCTLAQMYREVKGRDHHVLGGPMVYLREGIIERYPALAPLGIGFSYLFSVLTICAAFGGGNMFQVNQTYGIMAQTFNLEGEVWFQVICGLVIAGLVALVVVGGIKRIGKVTSAMVPAMCIGYSLICLVIIFANLSHVPELFASIFSEALTGHAAIGGFLGVMVQGMKRAAFSNEAGLGSAAIAHAASKTDEPVREGAVAMLGPFIDTHIVCTMTALAILITGVHENADGVEGVRVTSEAFMTVWPGFNYFLVVAVFVFAYSTLISWGYYGERAAEFLFGEKGLWPYRALFLMVSVVSPLLSLSSVVDFADMMLLSMAFPNIIGMVFLSGKVREATQDYIRRLRSGEMKPIR